MEGSLPFRQSGLDRHGPATGVPVNHDQTIDGVGLESRERHRDQPAPGLSHERYPAESQRRAHRVEELDVILQAVALGRRWRRGPTAAWGVHQVCFEERAEQGRIRASEVRWQAGSALNPEHRLASADRLPFELSAIRKLVEVIKSDVDEFHWA